jgi:hypothetical protein
LGIGLKLFSLKKTKLIKNRKEVGEKYPTPLTKSSTKNEKIEQQQNKIILSFFSKKSQFDKNFKLLNKVLK